MPDQPSQPAELGILIIHGIGEQEPGQTLVQFGEPFINFLSNWVGRAGAVCERLAGAGFPDVRAPSVKKVAVEGAVLIPESQAEPAHTTVELAAEGESGGTRWIVAESFWADCFPKPDPTAVTLWLMQVAPWIWISFLSRRLRLAWVKVGHALKGRNRVSWRAAIAAAIDAGFHFLAIPLLAPVVLLLELLLFLLLVGGLVPLPVIRHAVASANAKTSAILGDSYIFAESVVRREAIIHKVSLDLEWLSARCAQVAILAHSQGAAVAYWVLRRRCPPNARLLVTFGEGLLKLFQMVAARVEKGPKLTVIGSFLLGSAVYFVGGAIQLLSAAGSQPATEPLWWIPFVAWATALFLAVRYSMKENTGEIAVWARDFVKSGRHWTDIYASQDPVPNGPLLPFHTGGIESVEVQNECSIMQDHTSYQRNLEQFYPEILRAIDRSGITKDPIGKLTPVDDLMYSGASWMRRERIRSRRIDRALLCLATLAFLVNRELAVGLGGRLQALIGAILPRWIRHAVAALGRSLPGTDAYLYAVVGFLLILAGFWWFVNSQYSRRGADHCDLLWGRTIAELSKGRFKLSGFISVHLLPCVLFTGSMLSVSGHHYGMLRSLAPKTAFLGITPDGLPAVLFVVLLVLFLSLWDRVRVGYFLKRQTDGITALSRRLQPRVGVAGEAVPAAGSSPEPR